MSTKFPFAFQRCNPMSLLHHFVETAPRFLVLPLRIIPFAPQRIVLQKLLQSIFSEALEEGDFDFLQENWLCIHIDDLHLQLFFSVDDRGQLLIERQGNSDAEIKGGWKAFLQLASRQTDPDTLFFQRKLMISGNTDLCHAVKNLLDGIELGEKALRLQRCLASLNDYFVSRTDKAVEPSRSW